PQLLDALEGMMRYSGSEHEAAAVGQMSLFGGSLGAALKMDVKLLRPVEEIPPIEHKEMLEWEKEALGVHVSEHPLERPLALLQSQTSAGLQEIDANWNGRQVRVAGLLSHLRTLTTKRGEPMAFGTLEDLDSKIDLVFFPRTW